MTNTLALVKAISYSWRCTEKGKPVERQGRKATGLRVLPKAAEPPDANDGQSTHHVIYWPDISSLRIGPSTSFSLYEFKRRSLGYKQASPI